MDPKLELTPVADGGIPLQPGADECAAGKLGDHILLADHFAHLFG